VVAKFSHLRPATSSGTDVKLHQGQAVITSITVPAANVPTSPPLSERQKELGRNQGGSLWALTKSMKLYPM